MSEQEKHKQIIEKIDKFQAVVESIYDASRKQVKTAENLDIKLTNFIEKDTEWKKTAQPVIEMGQNVQGFGRVSLYILGFFASITGAIYGILELLKKKHL